MTGSPQKGYVLTKSIAAGSVAQLGLTAIPPTDLSSSAKQVVVPQAKPGAIEGIVWRDFKPGGSVVGKPEQGELGIPGVHVNLLDSAGKKVGRRDDGQRRRVRVLGCEGLRLQGQHRQVHLCGAVRRRLMARSKLITPSIILAYIWVWAGFAMVVIGAGLAAISREVLEAARTDGATEWQVFRRITVPMLAPVLSVVFITMLINVLKVFDIVISIAPGSTQSDASVIAVQMWRQSFGGVNDFGVGSAIAVFLFVLVIPVLLLNVRRFKREV